MVSIFGKPHASNFEFFFTASNFLNYSNELKIVRAESGILNAGANRVVVRPEYKETEAEMASELERIAEEVL